VTDELRVRNAVVLPSPSIDRRIRLTIYVSINVQMISRVGQMLLPFLGRNGRYVGTNRRV